MQPNLAADSPNVVFKTPTNLRYAISDIHGCNRTFQALLEKIKFNHADELFLLGDYVDRGPDSKGVIDTIWQLKADGYQVRCLRGNHEVMFSISRVQLDIRMDWQLWGGEMTLQSFGVTDPNDVPKRYFNFINNLDWVFDLGDYLLVHAGLDFKNPDGPLADLSSVAWQRGWEPTIDYQWLAGRTVVYGHTPLTRAEIEWQHENLAKNQYLDIDGGCPYAQWNPARGLGYLVAFELDERRLFFQENVESHTLIR